MKKILSVLLVLCLMLSCAAAAAEDGLTIVQETYVPLTEYDGYAHAQIFIEVVNNGTQDMQLGHGCLLALDADRRVCGSFDLKDWDMYPYVLAPGETAFIVNNNVPFTLGQYMAEEIPNYALHLYDQTAASAAFPFLTASGILSRLEDYESPLYEVTISITNPTGETIPYIEYIYGVYDEAGKLLFVSRFSVPTEGLEPGASMEWTELVNPETAIWKYWDAQGVKPAVVKVLAYAIEG
ncbi:MAG: hypothetical protein IKK21_01490 [Clostridia bacterium]|nr:hypothetical protein [Clostridia bacterium]